MLWKIGNQITFLYQPVLCPNFCVLCVWFYDEIPCLYPNKYKLTYAHPSRSVENVTILKSFKISLNIRGTKCNYVITLYYYRYIYIVG